MQSQGWSWWISMAGLALLSGCATPAVNPTGLTGGQVTCTEGPRPILDCRGALRQFARDFKAELSSMSQAQAGLGTVSTKLTEADALTSDLIQHYYQACTLYNACVFTREEYAAKTAKLQEIQLQVRQALVSSGYGSGPQQNININPPPYSDLPTPGSSPYPPMGLPPAFPPSPGFPQLGTTVPGPTPNIPLTQGPQDRVDKVLNILREGSKLLQAPNAPTPTSPALGTSLSTPRTPSPMAQPQENLDTSIRTMLVSLKQDVVRRNPALASARAMVGNFTEEGQPWSSPLGALLQERVGTLMKTEGLFRPAPDIGLRGVTLKQVAAVENPNDPKALGALYNTDLAIAGTYRPQSGGIPLRLVVLDDQGRELAQASKEIAAQAIPQVVATLPANAADTSQLLSSLNKLGPQAYGSAKVQVTTNRPGAGASFRLADEIRYFVTSTIDGYLYLFHIDADKKVIRLFPNQHQREARIKAGTTLEIPPPGAPFKFEASPPFGLETTFAIAMTVPLDENDFQMLEGGFAEPKKEIPVLVATRGVGIRPAESASLSSTGRGSSPRLVWNYVTVLIRP